LEERQDLVECFVRYRHGLLRQGSKILGQTWGSHLDFLRISAYPFPGSKTNACTACPQLTQRVHAVRQQDLDKLKTPFSKAETKDLNVGFSRRMGVDTPEIHHLYDEISKDLVGDPIFGIGWWAPHLGATRRILAGHYLVDCIHGIRSNLIEAKLHELEAVDYWEKESDFRANVVAIDSGGKVRIRMPPRRTPEEDLPHRFATLHVVGFFRALVGALDCLGASIIGVLALKADLRRADLDKARKSLKKGSHPIQVAFRDKFDQAVADSGPMGWLDWLIDYRNMVVHRGRRGHINQLVPRSPKIYGADGRIIPRTSVIHHLPSDPYRSQIEALWDDKQPPVLTEEAERTIRGALESSLSLMRTAGAELIESWKSRRHNPSILPQSRECWPDGLYQKSTGFVGYDPERYPYKPKGWIAALDVDRQLRTAALSDDLRNCWKSFD